MNNKKTVSLVSVLALALGFSTASLANVKKLAISPEQSKVEWKAEKKVMAGHNGTVAVKSGEIEMEKGLIKAGTLVIDMTKIAVVDIPATNADNKKLTGHLMADDFFGVTKNPEAKLVVKSSKQLSPGKIEVVGDLTIKGQTHPITFPVTVNEADGKVTAVGTMTVDRTKYGIRYGSENFFKLAADRIIKNTFDLTFTVAAVESTKN